MADQERALIVGAGSGLSASLARLFAREGVAVVLAARDTGKLAGIAKETGAKTYALEASDKAAVPALFERLDHEIGPLDIVVYNPSARVRGPFVELDPAAVE